MPEPLGSIPAHGNYRELLSYQKAELIPDLTFHFCQRFLAKGDRIIDQMVQAARPGKQNILEGSKTSGTWKEMEIRLTNVSRASQEKLRADHQDFLRVRNLPIWPKDSKETLLVGQLGHKSNMTYESNKTSAETRPPTVVANIALSLINQANYLQDQQIRRQEQ